MGTVAPTTGPGTGTGSPRDQYWSLNKVNTLNPKPLILDGAAHLGPPERGPPGGPWEPPASRFQGPRGLQAVPRGDLAKILIFLAFLPFLSVPELPGPPWPPWPLTLHHWPPCPLALPDPPWPP